MVHCVPERKAFSHSNEPSKTGLVVREAVVQIYKSSPGCRVISTPSNSACDVLMRSLKKVIPKSNMSRAKATFREKDEVPDDILSSCLYKEEYFACPSLEELRKFRALVTLANFADKDTTAVVTGRPGNSSSCVRYEIGRKMRLKIFIF
ncbi:hypothetical protein FEM48_Zijuj07G0005400 [Ziziphus jujuba var. spinosa]|uniref:Uncharacterized protein n=1 Tax=Ziziphus jujuba var. spinosa TaxID=714518 RepID=A0A978V1E2_ZIZJJ|nr:hypothetical protein FEM48_Zijuj07G0005400 [Ziziphus jujuba var. spinosa]